MANRANIDYHLHNMIGGPAASSTIQTIYKSEDGVLFCYGTAANTVLDAEANTYAPGCIYIKVSSGASVVYINEGTAASPDFDPVSTS